MKARYALPVMLAALSVVACGKKDSEMGNGVVASATAPVVTNPTYPGGLPFDQQCVSQGGQMISLNGQSVCRSPGVNTSLTNSYSVSLSLSSYSYPVTTSIPVRRGDTLRISNSGSNLTGYIYAWGSAASQFSVGSSYVGVQNQDGYLGFYITVPSGLSSVKFSLNQVRTERCSDAAGNFYQCP